MISKTLILSIIALNLSGCAYLTTFNKSVDLNGQSIAIDAKQRVIFSREKTKTYTVNNNSVTEKYSVLCAEPSPDALAVLGASGALTGSSEVSGLKGSGSMGLSEAAASIGLRTQSIQLLRDLNYRICEAYSNSAISEADTASLLRRGQSSMMGLIAIEQLTGPVIASQVALSTSANAGTGKTQSTELASARTAAEAKQEAVLKVQSEYDLSQVAHQENLQKLDELRAKEIDELSKDEANQDKALLASIREQIKSTKAASNTTEVTLKDKSRRVTYTQEEAKKADKRVADLEAASTSASADSASNIESRVRMASSVTKEVVGGVTEIVRNINTSYFREACFTIITDTIRQPDLLAQITSSTSTHPAESKAVFDALKATYDVCKDLLENDQNLLSIRAKLTEANK